MTKIIPCPVCEGKGYTLWVNTTEPTCSTGSKVCPHCSGTGQREIPMTNADRIRAMSDEELAELFHWEPICKNHYLDWLQQPCECMQERATSCKGGAE